MKESKQKSPHLYEPSRDPAVKNEVGVESNLSTNFKLALKYDNDSIGYLGVDSSGYCIITDNASSAVEFQLYFNNNIAYYKVASGEWKNVYYLSVTSGKKAALYGWSNATGMHLDSDGHLIDNYYQQKLSMYSSDGYLYFWDKYMVLEVSRVNA
jgi:hypothetical protein